MVKQFIHLLANLLFAVQLGSRLLLNFDLGRSRDKNDFKYDRLW